MTSTTLQPDPTNGIDTYIYSNAATKNWNYGRSTGIGVGRPASIERGLLKFDLSSIPVGRSITNATLSLYCTFQRNTTDYDVSVHRALVEWYEGLGNGAVPGAGVDASTWTYRNYNGSVAWSGGEGGGSGSDFAASPTATTSITDVNTWFDWDVLADVSAWYNGSVPNYGWFLLGVEGSTNTDRTFASSDYTVNITLRPKLVIEYEIAVTGRSFPALVVRSKQIPIHHLAI